MEKIKTLIHKYAEVIKYLISGGLTTVVSVGSYWIFADKLGVDPLIANIYSWILAVTFAFFINKLWVFESHTDSKAAFFKEMGLFYGARLASLGGEELILFLTIKLLGMNAIVAKVIAQVFVLVFNYIFSKLVIFKKKKTEETERSIDS